MVENTRRRLLGLIGGAGGIEHRLSRHRGNHYTYLVPAYGDEGFPIIAIRDIRGIEYPTQFSGDPFHRPDLLPGICLTRNHRAHSVHVRLSEFRD